MLLGKRAIWIAEEGKGGVQLKSFACDCQFFEMEVVHNCTNQRIQCQDVGPVKVGSPIDSKICGRKDDIYVIYTAQIHCGREG